jgi:chromate transporter
MFAYTRQIAYQIFGQHTSETGKIRQIIFLRDIFYLAVTSFGGAQAHLVLFFNSLVKKRNYLSETELIELNSFCNILPGPSSTQTLTAIGYKLGGIKLALLTLFVWIFPTTMLMIIAAVSMLHLQANDISVNFTRFVQPMAVSFVAFSAYKIISHSVNTKTSTLIFIFAAAASYLVRYPGIFPALLVSAGCITALRFKNLEKEQKEKITIQWKSLLLFFLIFAGAALMGKITDLKIIRLFENFFRNGSMIFGGGQPLSALFYKEFVEFKHYLSAEEFLSGFALQQVFPGPLFSFGAYIGALSMREYGILGVISGGLVASLGIFLPGTLLIFFMVGVWDKLKKYRAIKASLEGINAASAGIVTGTAFLLFMPMIQPLEIAYINYLIFAGTFALLFINKIPPPFIIIAGLVAGFIL